MAYNDPQELCLIQTLTASTSATISFTSGIGSNFNVYVVKLRNILPSSNAVTLRMLWSTNGGSSYLSSGYKWAMINSVSTGLSQDGSNSTVAVQVCNSMSSTAGRVMNGEIILYELNNSNFKTAFCYTDKQGSSGNMEGQSVMGSHTGTTAVNAIRFQAGSGNIASGTFSLYGVNEP